MRIIKLTLTYVTEGLCKQGQEERTIMKVRLHTKETYMTSKTKTYGPCTIVIRKIDKLDKTVSVCKENNGITRALEAYTKTWRRHG